MRYKICAFTQTDVPMVHTGLLSDSTKTMLNGLTRWAQDEAQLKAARRILEAYNRQEIIIKGSELLEIDADFQLKLDLSGLELTSLPPEIGMIDLLNELNLQDNHLRELPDWIGKIHGLDILNLNNNQLRKLPPEIGKLTALWGLYIDNNQLTELPGEIGLIENLHELHLANNQLRKLPAQKGYLLNLESLNLANNQLRELPDWIEKLFSKDFVLGSKVMFNSNYLTVTEVMIYERRFVTGDQKGKPEWQADLIKVKMKIDKIRQLPKRHSQNSVKKEPLTLISLPRDIQKEVLKKLSTKKLQIMSRVSREFEEVSSEVYGERVKPGLRRAYNHLVEIGKEKHRCWEIPKALVVASDFF